MERENKTHSNHLKIKIFQRKIGPKNSKVCVLYVSLACIVFLYLKIVPVKTLSCERQKHLCQTTVPFTI